MHGTIRPVLLKSTAWNNFYTKQLPIIASLLYAGNTRREPFAGPGLATQPGNSLNLNKLCRSNTLHDSVMAERRDQHFATWVVT